MLFCKSVDYMKKQKEAMDYTGGLITNDIDEIYPCIRNIVIFKD